MVCSVTVDNQAGGVRTELGPMSHLVLVLEDLGRDKVLRVLRGGVVVRRAPGGRGGELGGEFQLGFEVLRAGNRSWRDERLKNF